MSEMWSRDFAVLVKVTDLYERDGARFEMGKLLETFPAEQHGDVRHSLRRLGAHGYIETLTAGPTLGDPRVEVLAVQGVTEHGLRAVGAWPDDAELLADQLLAVLAERAKDEPEPEKRSKLAALGGMGRDVVVSVVSTTLARLMGGG